MARPTISGARWPWAVSWALALLAVSVGLPLLLMLHGIRSGRVSDWHISNRAERLKPMTIVTGLLATGVPLALLILFRGPSTLTLAFAAAFGLTLFNVIVTFWWKISQHVSTIAASAIVATGILGIWAAPSLLLVPLVAWARVRVGAHTVLQTIAGGAAGFTFGLGALLLFGGQ